MKFDYSPQLEYPFDPGIAQELRSSSDLHSERPNATERLNTLLTHPLPKILKKIPTNRDIKNLQMQSFVGEL